MEELLEQLIEDEVDYCPNCSEGIIIDGMCCECQYPSTIGRMDY